MTAPETTGGSDPATARRRDAAGTRRLLLDVARRRFATNGYTATTVRDVTDEAGVNVALVSRYFTSKEGLFEACLTSTVAEFGPQASDAGAADEDLAGVLAAQLAGPGGQEQSYKLLLLLRTSGDERAEQIRLDILDRFTDALAAAAGHDPGDLRPDTRLRAEMLLCTLLGVALLRATTTLAPLAGAGEAALRDPLDDVVRALLRT
ncbi:TetR/AcrR family transcriptional regulator [Geodermatophilaceae bacterium NBWT11]|nr:TetR/AcrR family transcriptional regulator [Geodermatophilaceae bacterium NBWT11]